MHRVQDDCVNQPAAGDIQIIAYWKGAVTCLNLVGFFSSRSCETWELHSHGLMCLLNAWNNNVISNPNLEHLGPDQSAYLPNDTCFPEECGLTTSGGCYWMKDATSFFCFWSRVQQPDLPLYVGMLRPVDPWVQQTMPKLWLPSPPPNTLRCFLIEPRACCHSDAASRGLYKPVLYTCVRTLHYCGVKLCPDIFSNIHEIVKVEVLHNILEKNLLGLAERESGSVISRKRGSCHITAVEDWWGCTASALWILHVLTKKH